VVDSDAVRIVAPAITIPVIVLALYLFLPGVREEPWSVLRIGGGVLALIGYILVLTARLQLRQSFSVQPKATGLITHGLYARIRHPMYVFLDLMIFGLALALSARWLFAVLVVLVVVQVLQSQREATVLREKFGQAYLDYRRRTWF
jgi:protein-S-isoprenylcysteine O-methyltransferase Ste14